MKVETRDMEYHGLKYPRMPLGSSYYGTRSETLPSSAMLDHANPKAECGSYLHSETETTSKNGGQQSKTTTKDGMTQKER